MIAKETWSFLIFTVILGCFFISEDNKLSNKTTTTQSERKKLHAEHFQKCIFSTPGESTEPVLIQACAASATLKVAKKNDLKKITSIFSSYNAPPFWSGIVTGWQGGESRKVFSAAVYLATLSETNNEYSRIDFSSPEALLDSTAMLTGQLWNEANQS